MHESLAFLCNVANAKPFDCYLSGLGLLLAGLQELLIVYLGGGGVGIYV